MPSPVGMITVLGKLKKRMDQFLQIVAQLWPRANASIPRMECLRSITSLAHLTVPKTATKPHPRSALKVCADSRTIP
jgi:hypothetical protein